MLLWCILSLEGRQVEPVESLLLADFFRDWYFPIRLLDKTIRLYRHAIRNLHKTLRRPPLVCDLTDRGLSAALMAQPPTMRPASLNSLRGGYSAAPAESTQPTVWKARGRLG